MDGARATAARGARGSRPSPQQPGAGPLCSPCRQQRQQRPGGVDGVRAVARQLGVNLRRWKGGQCAAAQHTSGARGPEGREP